ncbi:MAG: hypothetical protein NZO16_01725, partial [Deltaproteobacteria bacterium]|nr:hypothetical protein [Deltaproteobacteria bacterium]
YINYENVFYGVLILFSWIYAYRRGYYRELILCLIYYFFFEYNAWKPPPQPERYLLITYIFIIPLVSFLVAQSQLFIIRSLFLLSVGYNLVQQIILASSDLSSEKKLSEYVCNLPEQIVVHTGYVPRIECDKQILHLNLATARKIMSLKLPANQTLFITTNTHLYRYFEFRLARKHVRYSSLLFHLIKRLKLVKVIGSPILQKAYLNNTYYIYRSDTDFSDVLRSNFRFFRL